jgi:hypothetical protein
MCILDFGQDLSASPDGTLLIKNRLGLRTKILAYLAFPECDARRRTQVLAACGAQYLQQVRDQLDKVERECVQGDPQSLDDAEASRKHLQEHHAVLMDQLRNENVLPFGGGFGALADAAFGEPLETSVNAGLRDASLAGYQLLLTAIMKVHHDKDLRRGASLGKATDLTVWLGDKSKVLKSTYPVMKAWGSHKNVAHLSAAALLIGCVIRSAAPTISSLDISLRMVLENTEEFLQLSHDFFDFGLTFKSIGRTQTILDRESVWSLPVRVASLPLKPALFRLSDEQLEYLITKRWAKVPPEQNN